MAQFNVEMKADSVSFYVYTVILKAIFSLTILASNQNSVLFSKKQVCVFAQEFCLKDKQITLFVLKALVLFH